MKINKVYIAHNWAAKDMIRKDVLPQLAEKGITTTSRWLQLASHESYNTFDQKLHAAEDLEDIEKADAVLFFANQFGDTPGRGKYVELGYAMGLRKPIAVIGWPTTCTRTSRDGKVVYAQWQKWDCVFVACIPQYAIFTTVQAFLASLEAFERSAPAPAPAPEGATN